MIKKLKSVWRPTNIIGRVIGIKFGFSNLYSQILPKLEKIYLKIIKRQLITVMYLAYIIKNKSMH